MRSIDCFRDTVGALRWLFAVRSTDKLPTKCCVFPVGFDGHEEASDSMQTPKVDLAGLRLESGRDSFIVVASSVGANTVQVRSTPSRWSSTAMRRPGQKSTTEIRASLSPSSRQLVLLAATPGYCLPSECRGSRPGLKIKLTCPQGFASKRNSVQSDCSTALYSQPRRVKSIEAGPPWWKKS